MISRIVELLKETEKDSKNFFGQYGSQRMKDWAEIVTMYQKDNLFLAEAAQLLAQNVIYEIPGVKKSLARCDTVEADCDKAEVASFKREKELQEEFSRECRELGIEGGQVRKEVIELAKELPETYRQIAADTAGLSEACQLYQDFMRGLLDEGCSEVVLENLI